ncbi:uncharacterized protein J7T54_007600 [Emericellopsis cladophorae]|uniref:DUF7053 domain-containing protein n=1 Tax=Emericellopsis cladophorae TaxID=2686198 RepID=A0A9P9XXC6_9HYPO|nr:uncharacterized protein J7T54_007600 [Emericellopsis cladophorae]KAI6779145.1 hypothetical protein J7T54_007600 [Emericellopsis cladophorae]
MRVQRQVSIAVPIPPSLPPQAVIATLQTVSPVIRNLGTLSRFEETQAGGEPVAADQFFYGVGNVGNSPGGTPPAVSSYQIYELITLAPGLTKEVTYPAYFQRVPEGLRVRANGAAGITGWCEFTVRARGSHAGSPEGSGSQSGSTPSTVMSGDVGGYELYESIVVEANSLLMPFVVQTMTYAHRGLCDKVLQEAAVSYAASLGFDDYTKTMGDS